MLAGLLFTVAATPLALRGQAEANSAANDSDLAQQNFSRVAASAGEIKAVLTKDAGLMVELKQWVAKDATEHGQVVTDSDLTDEGIFRRLDTDIQFRSIATALVRRYGYLVPKLNPDSDSGREHELVLQERAKWIAQNQQEELAGERRQGTRGAPASWQCDPESEGNCSQSPARSPAAQGLPEQSLPGLPSSSPPHEENSPNSPGAPANSIWRAQLAQTAEGPGDNFLPLPFPDSEPSAPSVRGAYVISSVPLGSDAADAEHSVGAIPTGGNSNSAAGNESFSGYGLGSNAMSGAPPAESASRDLENSRTSASRLRKAVAVEPPSATVRFAEPPEMIRRANPYESVPSLYDMYVQAVARPVTPRRFGMDVFENGAQDAQSMPMDLPAGPEYVVGPGDGLEVDLWGGVSQRFYRVVDREGRVSLPEVGPVLVSGKTLAAVQESVQQVLRTQFRGVSADVSLSRLRSVRVYAVGDITNPGAYDISSLSTPLNALFAAGGPTTRGSLRLVKHYRGTQLVETVDLYDLLLHGVRVDLQRLENGDTVQVPPIGPQVTVEGMVRRPAIYELRDEKTLASVLDLAGGLLPAAALRHVEVQRLVAHDKQTMLSLDVPEGESSAEIAKKLEAFEIRDGDRIRVYPIAPYSQDAIYLEGHVVRPGRYSYRAGMRLSDLISSYEDLLPEPASQYAEIIRLNPPDFHPSVESFDLAAALERPAESPALQALDTVRIFSRFDFENAPTVSVGGGVRTPGTYVTSGQIRLADAVHLAGGLTRDADASDAQLFRYLPDGEFKILSVGLGRALAGNPTENILLEPRDRLLVHRNVGATDSPTVYIQGEVMRPGRYPLAQGMHVSDLIRLGGGFKSSADLELADLVEYPLEGGGPRNGAHRDVHIAAALADSSADNWLLRDGDTLTIRQISGWNDLGASIDIRGEVAHPGRASCACLDKVQPGHMGYTTYLRHG